MKPELLAPAGNPEKLKWAVAYGADAVYFGTRFGSLRSFAGNFTLEEAGQGLEYLHRHGKKGYAALNIYPFSEEYERICSIAAQLDEAGVDGIIVADMGVFNQLRKQKLNAPLHISTQANTTSCQAALAYGELGAKRVNLARELSLEQIKEIQDKLPSRLQTEVFIHGAVCFSYSGRCAISDYLTGYRANRGECKHPCRWNYHLVEEKRPGQYHPVFEDERGLYLFHSKDLALFEYVSRLAEAGVNSFKIEGRMKSVHYIAATVSLYRRIIDGEQISRRQAFDLLDRVPNRGYSVGFMKGSIGPEDYQWAQSRSKGSSTFVADVTETSPWGKNTLRVRNKIFAGETLELLKPDGSLSDFKMPAPLITTENKPVDIAHNHQYITLKANLPTYSLLRRLRNQSKK